MSINPIHRLAVLATVQHLPAADTALATMGLLNPIGNCQDQKARGYFMRHVRPPSALLRIG